MASNIQNDQWYSNKELFEMLQDLKEDLHNTRMDLRKYNDLRGAIAELQRSQLAQSEACKKHLSDPDSVTHKIQDQITLLKLEIEEYKSKAEGKKSVEDSFLRWGGWIFGLAGMVISIIKILSP